MQYQLPVCEMYPFGITGGTRGIKRGGFGIFIQIEEIIVR
jgi:hypothetical protein